MSETLLALPGSPMVKVELLDGPLMSAVAPPSRRARVVADVPDERGSGPVA
jgi:hypothetical protein